MAISLLEDCYKRREKVLGPQHPDTILSRDSLAEWQLEAMSLSEQEKYEQEESEEKGSDKKGSKKERSKKGRSKKEREERL